MNKKFLFILFLVLLFFAGIIALTQELDFFVPEIEVEAEETDEIITQWVKPALWFRSNAGGMALEEVGSRLVALRNEYALAVIFAHDDEFPEFLFPYYEDGYNLEIRSLYKSGEQIRTQWLFKDNNGVTRLNAVFTEKQTLNETENQHELPIIEIATDDITEEINDEILINEILTDELPDNELITDELQEELYIETAESLNETTAISEAEEDNSAQIGIIIDDRNGFIEIFDENSVLITEYRFYEDGVKYKTEYEVKDDLLISSVFFIWEEKSGYKKAYTDFLRYNRSLSLRSIERIFHIDISSSYNQVYVTFGSNLMDSAKTDLFISQRLNLYPDYFGDVYFFADNRMIIDTDDKSRIIRQTLYDEEDEIIWYIVNAWSDNRIVSTTKTEGETVLSAEYQYNSAGEVITERNYRNGSLERLVRSEGRKEIEELYINNILVLRAEWIDGIMISETRIRN